MKAPPRPENIALSIGSAVLCRIVLNTARRFVYPFAPVFSRGLAVPLTAVTSLIAAMQATSVLGVLSGPVADRFGYRRMMLAGMVMLIVGMGAAGFAATAVVVMPGLFLAAVGKSIYDPAIQAYVGERVPYHRRGLAIGLLETAWAGSTLIAVPLISLLMNRYGWRSPFFALGIAGFVGMLAMARLIPGDAPKKVQTGFNGRAWLALLGQTVRHRPALGMVIYAFFMNMANDNMFVVYGAWLESSFGIGIVALGMGTGVIGLAESCGEGLTALVADRLGLKRAVVIGLLMTILSYTLIPLCGRGLTTALGGLFLLFLSFEFTIVTSMSLGTEVLPSARATMMSAFLAAAGMGRVCGALMGGPLWLAGGIAFIGAASAVGSVLALGALLWGLHRWRRDS